MVEDLVAVDAMPAHGRRTQPIVPVVSIAGQSILLHLAPAPPWRCTSPPYRSRTAWVCPPSPHSPSSGLLRSRRRSSWGCWQSIVVAIRVSAATSCRWKLPEPGCSH